MTVPSERALSTEERAGAAGAGTSLARVVGVPGVVLMGLGSILGTGIFVNVGVAAGIAVTPQFPSAVRGDTLRAVGRTIATCLVLIASGCSGADGSPDPPASDGGLNPSREGLVPIVEDCTVPEAPEPSEINLANDVEYSVAGGEALLLDVAWPLAGGPHPLVVMIHGGGWIIGDKTDERARGVIVRLAAIGYAAASINYRLVQDGENLFPAAVEDVRCAVRWLQANADSYAIDPSRVAAVGASAGGHLALMLGTAGDEAGLDGSCALAGPVELDGVVSFYGPSDLRSGSPWGIGEPMLETFLGQSPDQVPELARLASPIAHIDAGDRPHLLLHGSIDSLVLPEQSRNLQAAFEAAGVASTYVELADTPHAFELITEDRRYRVSTCTTLSYLATMLDTAPSP